MVGEAAPLLGILFRGLPHARSKLGDQVLEVPAAAGDGLQELRLVLLREQHRDGGKLDDLLRPHLEVIVIVAGDRGDHRGLGQAAGYVCRDGKGPERSADVQNAFVAFLTFLLDEIHDLGCSVHDVPLVHTDDRYLEKSGKFVLHLVRDLTGDAFTRGVIVPEYEGDAVDGIFPVAADRVHQPVLVVADEHDMRICH